MNTSQSGSPGLRNKERRILRKSVLEQAKEQMESRAVEKDYNKLIQNEYMKILGGASDGLQYLKKEIYENPEKFDN